jgi:2-keto-4-pentenoate hydratase/2-oxohepta-3-ene-1,7-dioic acid hydratase in catechol pathway
VKIVRFEHEGVIRYGVIEADKTVWTLKNGPYVDEPVSFSGESFPLSKVKILAPCAPSKIVAVGLNYKGHEKELDFKTPDHPVLFLKPPSSILDPEGTIVLPSASQQVDYEAELAFVIKKNCRNVTAKEALHYILGYTCLNDVTARDLQKLDGQWTRAKGFDTFTPFGPWIVSTDSFDPKRARIQTLVNGVVKQEADTGDLIFDVPTLLEHISGVMTLLPGDVITTGTPQGVGPLRKGDVVEIRIEGIGVLRNHVY